MFFYGFLVVFDSVEILLSELEYVICAGCFVEAAHYAVGEEITETVLIFEALAYEQECVNRFLSFLLLFLVGEGLHGSVVAVIVNLLGEFKLHVVEVDSGWVFIVVERWDSQGGNWQDMRHSLWKLHVFVF